jgi:hypothetical protein
MIDEQSNNYNSNNPDINTKNKEQRKHRNIDKSQPASSQNKEMQRNSYNQAKSSYQKSAMSELTFKNQNFDEKSVIS